jgi:hypothetical protein
MITLKNVYYSEFVDEVQDKDIVVFGAGGTLNHCLSTYRLSGQVMLMDKIVAILDNDSEKTGSIIEMNKRAIAIETIEGYLGKGKDFQNCVILLMLVNPYLMQVVEQLNALSELNGMICYNISWNIYKNPLEKPKLVDFASIKYSQCGEDGIIAKIFETIPPPPPGESRCVLSLGRGMVFIYQIQQTYGLTAGKVF